MASIKHVKPNFFGLTCFILTLFAEEKNQTEKINNILIAKRSHNISESHYALIISYSNDDTCQM